MRSNLYGNYFSPLRKVFLNYGESCRSVIIPDTSQRVCNKQSALQAPKYLPRVEITICLLYISSISKCICRLYIQTKCHQLFV